jgi:hypothetical protein
VLIAPDKGSRGTPKRWLTSGRARWMRTVLAADYGHERYRKRKQTVEPLFGNTKHNGSFYRFHRRGRIKVRLEWRLLMMTHNLTKLTVTSSSPRGPETGPQSVTPALTADAIPTTSPPSTNRAIARAVCATASTRGRRPPARDGRPPLLHR